MFRLAPPEMEYVINHSECKAFFVSNDFVPIANSLRSKLTTVLPENYVFWGDDKTPEGYRSYESLLTKASPKEPDLIVDGDDVWVFMYTSGTTGKPKGVVRTHESNLGQYLLSDLCMGVRPDDCVMLVMPMCHVNSIFYSFAYTYVSAKCFVYNMISFDPEDLLRTIEKEKITFTSLVPTHYIMMLSLPDDIKKNINVSSIRQLLISSAPARKDTKLAIMDYFKNAELWEAYGSTESSLVTLLRPEEQFKKLGSIGREIWGTDRIKILDENGNEVPRGQVGELYSRTPGIFKEYWKDPEKTKSVFRGDWFSAGDMAYQDEDGYYTLVDRKANMIITGGENVFPSEVENILGSHPAVKYVAVIGIPHEKWGESVKAVVSLHQGKMVSEKELIDHCRGKIAGYKIPKSVDFIKDEEMPMTATGKIIHRILREKYGKWSDVK
jgi:acyl-CoA synthetase (AMP-forming)/AMP-acid ligase II